MDEYIKQSIEGRKNAIGATYEVSAEMRKKNDALFGEIEELGAECKDVGDFEAQFAVSPLNQKYLDLFTEVATNSQAKIAAPKVSKSEISKISGWWYGTWRGGECFRQGDGRCCADESGGESGVD